MRRQGFTILEVVAALAILGGVVLTLCLLLGQMLARPGLTAQVSPASVRAAINDHLRDSPPLVARSEFLMLTPGDPPAFAWAAEGQAPGWRVAVVSTAEAGEWQITLTDAASGQVWSWREVLP